MDKLTLFVSKHCPHCPPVINELDNLGIEYRKVDISNSMPELKEFLKLRDNNDYFDKIKEKNLVGVPTIMTEDGKLLDPNEIDLKSLK